MDPVDFLQTVAIIALACIQIATAIAPKDH